MDAAYHISVRESKRHVELSFYHSKSNAMNSEMLEELALLINKYGQREDLCSIVLESEGKVFCAGAFFDELLEVQNQEQGEKFFRGFAEVIYAMINAKPLVVTKVQGKAIGGAVGIIAASDYVICSDSAQIRLSELAIGIGPFVISPVIKHKIGVSNFIQLALNPKEWFGAEWMGQKGLAHEIVKPNDLNVLFEEKVQELDTYNPSAVQAVKVESVPVGDLDSELKRLAGVSGRLVQTDITKDILKTFLSR